MFIAVFLFEFLSIACHCFVVILTKVQNICIQQLIVTMGTFLIQVQYLCMFEKEMFQLHISATKLAGTISLLNHVIAVQKYILQFRNANRL